MFRRTHVNIDAKLVQGTPLDDKNKLDNPVIIEAKDGNKFRPKRLVYTFATPEGVKANADFMDTQLRIPRNQDFLSFEIINSKGEKKIIDKNNISELGEQKLNQWLYPN